ncbi:MAG TPA: DHHA2 domain-containing protein, partial [Chondromyces sp.]|nr:DHHA2 domain-containing protein [Chondromyces sp.]
SKVEIAQVNTVDAEEVLSRQAELEAVLSRVIDEKGLDLFLLVVTDILTNDSIGLVMGDRSDTVEKAFEVSLDNKRALLKGVVSRKKQIVPLLTNAF